MTHPRRKKVRVFHIPQDEIVSVTRVSSSGSGHQVMTQTSLPAPWQDHAVEPGRTSPAPHHASPTSCGTESQAKKRYLSTDEPLTQWLPHRDSFLDELYWRYGLHCSTRFSRCAACLSHNECARDFRCVECTFSPTMCSHLMLQAHQGLPLHRIEVWNGRYFEAVTLKDLGLTIQLGHDGAKCPMSVTGPSNFTVIHINGIHNVRVTFCGCSNSFGILRWHQLMRIRWFPSTTSYPETCTTFQALRQCHLLTLHSKLSTFQFYGTLSHLTDNTGLSVPPDRYKHFLRMMRQWRHLHLLKRAGRGFYAEGANGTKFGELALQCPACPQPGINLSPDWVKEHDEKPHLFQRILSLDGSFRLENSDSPISEDPLGPGWCIFVPPFEYKSWLSGKISESTPSTCSGLLAVNHANSKKSRGLRATGVGAAICARHEFFLPNGMGDLQKGERYCNMDYIFASSLRGISLKKVTVSYDISCQWSVKLIQRLKLLPENLSNVFNKLNLEFAVPKLHINGHKSACWTRYGFNYRPGVGRTDGEGIERRWADANDAATSTKEMRDGHRQDVLDDVCNESNYRKTIDLGSSLSQKLITAKGESAMHEKEFELFSRSIPEPTRTQWLSMVASWESDHTKPNPYTVATEFKTQAEVRLELIQMEKTTLSSSEVFEKMSASSFLTAAFDIEDSQYILQQKVAALNDSPTATQEALVQENRLVLGKRILNFRATQTHIMPEVALLPEDSDCDEPESISLRLPSELIGSRSFSLVGQTLANMEAQLRFAQATDALSGLRGSLAIRAELSKYKEMQVRGQHANTRARALLSTAQEKTAAFAARYRRARLAYSRLTGPGDWENTLRPLMDTDIRTLTAHQDEAVLTTRTGPREGHRVISWIYMVPGTSEESMQLDEALRVEWLKARAQRDRWMEEVDLLTTELTRTAAFFDSRVNWWTSLIDKRSNISPELSDGLSAYAERQADIQR